MEELLEAAMLGFLATITHNARSAGPPPQGGGATPEDLRSSSKFSEFQSVMRLEEEGGRDETDSDMTVSATDSAVRGESPDDEEETLLRSAGIEENPDQAEFDMQETDDDILLSNVEMQRNGEIPETSTSSDAEASGISVGLARNSGRGAVDLSGSMHSDTANRETATAARDGFLTRTLPHSGPLSGAPPFNQNEAQEDDPDILLTKKAIEGLVTRARAFQEGELSRAQTSRNSDTQDRKDKAELRLVADMPVTIRTRQSDIELALPQKMDLPSDQRLAGQLFTGENIAALDASKSLLDLGEDAGLRTDAPVALQAKAEMKHAAFGTSNGAQVARHVAGQMFEAMTTSNERSIDVFFSPPELGRVRLTLSHTELGMFVNVAAERTETLDLMRRHGDILSQEFQSLGYGDTKFTFAREEHEQREDQSDTAIQVVPEAELPSVTSPPERTGLIDRLDIRL